MRKLVSGDKSGVGGALTNKLIGTTLLVKGLEYHHAIILEAESMSPKELYVALTRGAKTITIVSLANTLPA